MRRETRNYKYKIDQEETFFFKNIRRIAFTVKIQH